MIPERVTEEGIAPPEPLELPPYFFSIAWVCGGTEDDPQ